MEVIPFTLGLSLLLSLTFIALFLREFTRPRRAGAEHDSLLPLDSEQAAVVIDAAGIVPARHVHGGSDDCSGGDPTKPRCSACRTRQERAARRAAA